ncbi:protoporphyrinogen oxidase [Pseudonocardia hierapolitana]|uniref:protoporphyrinogen oxidase n=1 Tax=Pseudonocardia hierapolitana TaxID=1128676 RepID=UPI0011BEBBC0|nr:protoporphyrinogen oxidase [Pseudonocardia hierapolitana]
MARVAVVGGGISGLAAAHRLRTLLGPTARIDVLEQRDRIGGVLHTVDLAGVAFDVGAEAFLARRPEVPALLAELGLTDALVHPTGAAASVRAAGRTGPLPAGTLMGVPTSAARLDGLLSDAGLATVAAEPERPLSWEPGGDVVLGGLLRARFGDEIADRLADPLLGGVYAGRVDALGLRATVPALAAALDAGAPSLTAAADTATHVQPGRDSRAPTPRPAGSARVAVSVQPSREVGGEPRVGGHVFGAVRGGYGVLLDSLVAASGAEVRLRTTVRELQRREGGWRLVLGPTTAPEALDVDAVVLAVPAPAAARLLAGAAPAAARAAGEIELASSVVVALAFRAEDATSLPSTSGVLVAADEPMAVKAFTHSSNKWAHLAGGGLVRLRASLGRFGEAATLQVDDAELIARARADLGSLTGVTAAPVATHVQRWGGGLPQYGVGHLDRVRAIEDGLPAGVAVAGAALHGVGVPACIATGRAAAERVAATG